MAIVVEEHPTSRSFGVGVKAGTTELVYRAFGDDDDLAIKAAVLAAAPVVYDGMAIENVDARAVDDDFWEVVVRYSTLEGQSEYTFDTGGGNVRITQSISTINSYAASGTPPDFQGAIGVTTDAVEGVDITSPVFNFTETHYIDDSLIDGAYKLALFRLTGRVNDTTFKGFAAGEVLFLGASGSKRGDEKWAITFRFAASPNATGLSIGSISGVDKGGWEYLWVRYEDTADTIAFALVKQPSAVYIEQVYYSDDFSDLGIGT